MQVVVDTVVIWALVPKSDQYHKAARDCRNYFQRRGATFMLPRTALIETIGHATRITGRGTSKEALKAARVNVLDHVLALGWGITEHVTDDYADAEAWWRKYADWPIDYPDAIIAATARRLKADHLWTYDKEFSRFLYRAVPEVKLIRSPAPD